ncbi:MAG: hypothetical protein OEX00_03600 [Gammaproteobacteria bacterium]|nr:hypothetical protein [Gammaproteobacteria bacterium]MDH5693024.1 hypothetical protein [Gammaproteobacteria bacterium]
MLSKKIRINTLFSLLLVLSSANVWAWTEKDTWWETAYMSAHIADWGQTRDIAAQCDAGPYYETNPVLGRCPSTSRVNSYFLGTALLHVGVSHILPGKVRRIFQVGTLGMQLNFVSSNAQIGLKVNF